MFNSNKTNMEVQESWFFYEQEECQFLIKTFVFMGGGGVGGGFNQWGKLNDRLNEINQNEHV